MSPRQDFCWRIVPPTLPRRLTDHDDYYDAFVLFLLIFSWESYLRANPKKSNSCSFEDWRTSEEKISKGRRVNIKWLNHSWANWLNYEIPFFSLLASFLFLSLVPSMYLNLILCQSFRSCLGFRRGHNFLPLYILAGVQFIPLNPIRDHFLSQFLTNYPHKKWDIRGFIDVKKLLTNQ